MPNWVTNKLTFKGENAEEIVKSLLKEEDGELRFDFNKLIPRPKDLDIEWSSDSDMGIKLISGFETKETLNLDNERYERCIKLGAQTLSNLQKYGYANWHDWSINNWGTKWNAINTQISKDGKTLYFDTAWSHPMPIINKLMEKYPQLTIDYKYLEEGEDSYGEMYFTNGKCFENKNCDLEEIRCELWYDMEEILEGECQ